MSPANIDASRTNSNRVRLGKRPKLEAGPILLSYRRACSMVVAEAKETRLGCPVRFRCSSDGESKGTPAEQGGLGQVVCLRPPLPGLEYTNSKRERLTALVDDMLLRALIKLGLKCRNAGLMRRFV